MQKARLFFYACAIICFVIAMYFLVSTIQQGAVLAEISGRTTGYRLEHGRLGQSFAPIPCLRRSRL